MLKSLIYKRLEGLSLCWAMLTLQSKFSNSRHRQMLNESVWSLLSSFQFLLSTNLSATDAFLSAGVASLWINFFALIGPDFQVCAPEIFIYRKWKGFNMRNQDQCYNIQGGRTWLYKAVYRCQASASKQNWSVYISHFHPEQNMVVEFSDGEKKTQQCCQI